MAANCFRLFANITLGPEDDGILERISGCNGGIHVDALDLVFYGPDGKVEYAEPRGFEVRGSCDGSCGEVYAATPENRRGGGWFTYNT